MYFCILTNHMNNEKSTINVMAGHGQRSTYGPEDY